MGGRTLELVSGHPWPPRIHWNGYYQGPDTREHIRRLLALAGSGQPTIIVGDFNFTDRHSAYAEFAAAGLTDAFRAAGNGRGGLHRFTWEVFHSHPC